MFTECGVSLLMLVRPLDEWQGLEGALGYEVGVSERGFLEGDAEGSTLGFLSGGESTVKGRSVCV